MSDSRELHIDGAQGEGGGQVVRTSLALSCITGRPVHLTNVRAGRKKPGLLRQHLTGLRAAAAITGAEVDGDVLKSREVRFSPGPVVPGEYRFAVGSAGSANLVLQTILPPLMLANGPSTVVVEGGTHNMKSPPHRFLEATFLPQLRRFGPEVRLDLEAWGFFPAGGGRMVAHIEPVSQLHPNVSLTDASDVQLSATAVVANLPEKIAARELKVLRRRLDGLDGLDSTNTRVQSVPGPGPGNVVWVEATVQAEGGPHTTVFTGFGQKGRTAEQVAKRLAGRVRVWLERGAPVCEHLADQLLIPMALAGSGTFRTGEPSLHTLTNMAVIEQFLPVSFTSEQQGDCWTIGVRQA